MNCKYKIPDSNMCNWFFENMIGTHGHDFLHFPFCSGESCPLKNSKVITDMLNTKGVKIKNEI